MNQLFVNTPLKTGMYDSQPTEKIINESKALNEENLHLKKQIQVQNKQLKQLNAILEGYCKDEKKGDLNIEELSEADAKQMVQKLTQQANVNY